MDQKNPWYVKEGLRFSCQRCGGCCTGDPGFIWVSDEEITEISAAMGLNIGAFVTNYTRLAHRGRTLRERPDGSCVLFDKERGCILYDKRPRQCRSWPFWRSNVKTPKAWNELRDACPGINEGPAFTPEQVIQMSAMIDI